MALSFKRLGASTLCFRHSSVAEALPRLRQAGFAWVDLVLIPRYCPHYNLESGTADSQAQLAGLLARLGLRVASLNADIGNMAAQAEEQTALVRRGLKLMHLAHTLKAGVVTLPCGPACSPAEFEQVAYRVADTLQRLSPLAEAAGVQLTVEAPHAGTLCCNSHAAVALLDLAGAGIGCTFDTGHVAAAGELAVDAALQLKNRLAHVHLRDARADDALLTPGDGEVDFPGVIGRLNDFAYRGHVVVELEVHDPNPDVAGRELGRARDFLQPYLVDLP